MVLHRVAYLTRYIRKFRKFSIGIICLSLLFIFIYHYQYHQNEVINFESFDDVKILLDQLFNSSTSLDNIQIIWNKLIKLWSKILRNFLHDACQFCYSNHTNCSQLIDLNQYIFYINQSFYPYDETKRPNGMGIFYYFDLKTLHSLNNSVLPIDRTYCDYFHMVQLMINVQIILHQSDIKYFLTKGTLVGTLRHHDIIPWDTDMDLFIPLVSVQRLFKTFNLLKQNQTNKLNYQQTLVMYGFKNNYKVLSYKIFSLQSKIIPGASYRWPKIDLFTYQENLTHIYAYPTQTHNIGTMKPILKKDIEPISLRLLGPLFIPSPYHPRKSIKSMVRLGTSDVFYVCQGNTYLSHLNQPSNYTWRLPCRELHQSYTFVESEYNLTSNLCYEQLISYEKNQTLSYYIYKCDENLNRTFT